MPKITFTKAPIATGYLADQFYIFEADIEPGVRYENIGGQVQQAAKEAGDNFDQTFGSYDDEQTGEDSTPGLDTFLELQKERKAQGAIRQDQDDIKTYEAVLAKLESDRKIADQKDKIVTYIGTIETPGFDVDAKLRRLWLIFKGSSNTPASSYAIVADLDEEINLVDPAKLGVVGDFIDTKVSIRAHRLVYSHNLDPDLMSSPRSNILGKDTSRKPIEPILPWPLGFKAGIMGIFSLCIGDGEYLDESTSTQSGDASAGADASVTDTKISAGASVGFEDAASASVRFSAKSAYTLPLVYNIGECNMYGPNGLIKPDPDMKDEEECKKKKEEPKKEEEKEEGEAEEKKGKPDEKNQKVGYEAPAFSIEKVKHHFQGMSLVTSADLKFSLGPLSAKTIGLAARLDFRDMSISLGVKGAGVSYSEQPVSIAGALIRQKTPEFDTLDGGLFIGLPLFELIALGSIGTVQKQPTVFFYGMLKGELITIQGILSITGLALTLGMNRKLLVPNDASEVPNHPLIKAVNAEADDLTDMVKSIKKFFPPTLGSFFFGFGVQATLVQTIEVFLMPIISFEFGVNEEVHLVDFGEVKDIRVTIAGVASLGLPKEVKKDKRFLDVGLVIMADFSLMHPGDIMVIGALRDESVIRVIPGKELKISGGFAFFRGKNVDPGKTEDFKKELEVTGGYDISQDKQVDPEKEGDSTYVITVGGYGTIITPAPNWPSVDPIEIAWKPTDDIEMSVSFYFFKVPNFLGAGFDVSGKGEFGGSGFSAKVDFKLAVNVLVQFAPFKFTADMVANFRAAIKAGIEKWGVSITKSFTFDIFANVVAWGGEGIQFSGRAELHFHLLFSINFEVAWGDSEDKAYPISWDDFKKEFVPMSKEGKLNLAGIELMNNSVLDVKQTADKQKLAIVDPEALEIRTEGYFPNRNVKLNETDIVSSDSVEKLGIQTVGWTAGDYEKLDITLAVEIEKEGEPVHDLFDDEEVRGSVPAGLFHAAERSGEVPEPDPHGEKFVKGVLKGLKLKPKKKVLDESTMSEVDKEVLSFDIYNADLVELLHPEEMPVHRSSSEEEFLDSLNNSRPQSDVLQALGLEEEDEAGFSPLTEKDYQAIPLMS